jgi:tetratricopeptide (TPR) repeat protein
VSHHLAKLQFNRVIQASNGMEALDIIRTDSTISAIICAMDMPNMNGLELLQELREDLNAKRVPFCLAMDNVSKEKIMLSVEHGVDEVLVKPFTLGDIIPKMRSAFKIFHNPSNPELIYELAKDFIKQNKLDKAAAVYTELMNTTEKSARPLVGLARIEKFKGNYDAALKFLETAEAKNPNYVHVFSLRGDIYSSQKNWNEALAQYRKGIELSPLNPIRYISAVEVMMQQKKYKECVDLLSLAIKRELTFPDLHHYLSQASFNLKDYKQAIKHIKHAIQNDQNNLEYMNQLAISYKESDQLEEAQKVYNSIIKFDPDNLAALFNKAIMLHKKGSLDDAIKIMERISMKHPDFAQAKTKIKEYQEERNKAGAA